ncbi:MAG: hypothetical protein IJA89_08170 [Clostridia bacterium]|nr:hypothetical protein [Clostridia bacterium]
MKKNTTKKIAAILSFAVVCAGALGVASLNKATADTAVNPDCFEMVEGASIRLASDKNGIRFTSKYGSKVYQDITTREAGTDVRVGTFIFPAAYLDMQAAYETGAQIGEYDKLLNKKDACFYDSTDDTIENKLYQDGDYYYGYAALTNMQFENLGLDFVGIGYIAWTTGNTTTYEFIENEETVVRSAAYVASAHYGKETDATKVEVVDHYVYGSLFAKTGVVDYDATAGQYTVYDNDTYATVAEVMDAINGSLELAVSATELSVAYPATSALTATVQLKYADVAGGEATAIANGVNFAVKCESSNPAAATYENGVVKSVGAGATTLTFSCMDLTATCNVTVVQRTTRNLKEQYFDLSKDTTATIALDEGEIASEILVGETDILSDVTATAGSVSISKEVLETWDKGTTHVQVFTDNYQYNAYVCVADYVLSDEAELKTFRAAAVAASDQNGQASLTYSDTWDWHVVLDADITCTSTYMDYVSYFGVLDGKGHAISDIVVGNGHNENYARVSFFDNRIERGDEGVLDSDNVMHADVGLRVKDLAIINIRGISTASANGHTRGAFVNTTTKGSRFENIYFSGLAPLVSQYLNGACGVFKCIVVDGSTGYFPMSQAVNKEGTNVEEIKRILMYGANPQLPVQASGAAAYGCAVYATNNGATMTDFYNGVIATINAVDDWSSVWSVADNGDIMFGDDTVIIANPAN